MDNEATAMRQQMDETMAGLTDKLGDLGYQVSGTVRTVKNSVDTVRDTFNFKLQVRRRPWTALAGAAALGYFLGSRSNNCGAAHATRNETSTRAPVARVADDERPQAGANDGTNGAAETAPSWVANLGATFQPEIAALRGVAAGALLQLLCGSIMKQSSKPIARSAGDTNNGSNGKSRHQEGLSR